MRTCSPGKILNPKTNRCVDINGKIGRLLIASSIKRSPKKIENLNKRKLKDMSTKNMYLLIETPVYGPGIRVSTVVKKGIQGIPFNKYVTFMKLFPNKEDAWSTACQRQFDRLIEIAENNETYWKEEVSRLRLLYDSTMFSEQKLIQLLSGRLGKEYTNFTTCVSHHVVEM